MEVTPAIEPVGIAQAIGKFAQPATDAILDHGQTLLMPGSRQRTVRFSNDLARKLPFR